MKINITPSRLAAIAKSKAGQVPGFLKKELGAAKNDAKKAGSAVSKTWKSYRKWQTTDQVSPVDK